MFKNLAGQKVVVFAWDLATQQPAPGVGTSLRVHASYNGASPPIPITDVTATEISAAVMPGFYAFDLALNETAADMMVFGVEVLAPGIGAQACPPVVHLLPSNLNDTIISSMLAGIAASNESLTDMPSDMWDGTYEVEAGFTPAMFMRGFAAFVMGLAQGGNVNPKFRDMANSKYRIQMTVDGNGNRTVVLRDLTQ